MTGQSMVTKGLGFIPSGLTMATKGVLTPAFSAPKLTTTVRRNWVCYYPEEKKERWFSRVSVH